METEDRIEEGGMEPKPVDGRDELNLAEFPLCALAHRLPPDQKTLRFEDQVWDESRGERITRQLVITGSDAYGLPTALDDEVLLGLIQLTRLRGFRDRKVPFTRGQLLQLLGWRDDSKSYHRVESSLNRWTGVTLYYQRAWWNKARKCWMDEKFHILDNVWLCHRAEPPPDTGLPVTGAPQSAFVWNEVVFRSFQAGNLKSIDFEFYKSLRGAVAKRLYRFLDKRFRRRRQCEFDLREFACEHAGLARSYDCANLKRKLLPGIRELEGRGFLRPAEQRFRKQRAGEWRVVFEKLPESQAETARVVPSAVTALVQRGVTPAVAHELCSQHPAALIETQVRAFDWLLEQRKVQAPRNPPGYLVSSIRDGYAAPPGFAAHPLIPKGVRRAKPERSSKVPPARGEAREPALDEFWKALTPEQRLQAEREALQSAAPLQREIIERGGKGGATLRRALLLAYARSALAAKN